MCGFDIGRIIFPRYKSPDLFSHQARKIRLACVFWMLNPPIALRVTQTFEVWLSRKLSAFIEVILKFEAACVWKGDEVINHKVISLSDNICLLNDMSKFPFVCEF